MQAAQKILVVGGNGFIGSAVCKAALARGMDVTSISSSGAPYRTPAGHTPAWAAHVAWTQADALRPATYAHLLPRADAVVHTLGTLLPDPGAYKRAVRAGSVVGLLGAMVGGGGGNPLQQGGAGGSAYEVLNRDAALRVCEAFVAEGRDAEREGQGERERAFVYISAEDIFRPLISARYIETKREAEQGIQALVRAHPGYRGVFIRPSLVYHPHHRPLTSPLAALLDASASLHAAAPSSFPTPARILRALAGRDGPESALASVANALSVPPIHVEHVAEAVVAALDPASGVRGVLGVRAMRTLIGWAEKGADVPGRAV
ncbi:NAD(P)-binding protein [Athelia psychrophila]|uniref:NAD(P)-binding protein n=1 Tax=Athelia psychrophila TaxID=1759441 RepID=A0A166I1Z9_9AGAM|nr:NAD(P)-binding protein [Fibularhizoctonia sp. CBS 109695]